MKSLRILILLALVAAVPACADPYARYEQIAVWQGDRGRIYSIYSPDENWTAMEKFARTKVIARNRMTEVLFFSRREYAPDETALEEGEFSRKARRYWIARYERRPSGRETFEKYPGRKRR